MSSPYQILKHSQAYSFSNKKGINYICRFTDVTNHYAPILGAYDIKLKDFSFYPDKHTNERDSLTGETICNLVASEFDENTVMTYVCDEGDGRQEMRQYRFQKWVERYLSGYTYQPVNITLETDNGPYKRFAGLLYTSGFKYEQLLHTHLINKIGGIVNEKMGM